jgi:hypothetical protein
MAMILVFWCGRRIAWHVEIVRRGAAFDHSRSIRIPNGSPFGVAWSLNQPERRLCGSIATPGEECRFSFSECGATGKPLPAPV